MHNNINPIAMVGRIVVDNDRGDEDGNFCWSSGRFLGEEEEEEEGSLARVLSEGKVQRKVPFKLR